MQVAGGLQRPSRNRRLFSASEISTEAWICIQIQAFGKPTDVAQCIAVAGVGAPDANEIVIAVEASPINQHTTWIICLTARGTVYSGKRFLTKTTKFITGRFHRIVREDLLTDSQTGLCHQSEVAVMKRSGKQKTGWREGSPIHNSNG